MASVIYGKCYLWQMYYGKCNYGKSIYGKSIMAHETEPLKAMYVVFFELISTHFSNLNCFGFVRVVA